MNKASDDEDDPLPHIQLHPSVYELFPPLRSLCHFHFPTLSDSPHSQFHHVCCGLMSPCSLKIHCFCVFLPFRPSSLKPPAAHIHLHLIVRGQVFPCESQTAAPKPPSFTLQGPVLIPVISWDSALMFDQSVITRVFHYLGLNLQILFFPSLFRDSGKSHIL